MWFVAILALIMKACNVLFCSCELRSNLRPLNPSLETYSIGTPSLYTLHIRRPRKFQAPTNICRNKDRSEAMKQLSESSM